MFTTGKIAYRIVWEPGPGDEIRERVEAVKRWFVHDWQALDNKVKSSIVEGVSVFLAMFDMPDVARVFCPDAPEDSDDPQAIEVQAQIRRLAAAKENGQEDDKKPDGGAGAKQPSIPSAKEGTLKGAAHLPPIYELIEGGGVLALNMPAGVNPALARAVGVMLKNAWLQALLMRPAKMKAKPSRYFRPAVFICDEYQAFASVGEDDPSGDEKSFALTRQCRCIPIVATQSISSLRAVLGSSEAWRALLQTLRTPDFPISQRRRIRQHRKRTLRAGGENQGIVHHQRDLQAGGSLPALWPRRWRRREHRRDQIIPGATRGRVSPARLRLALQLSSDLFAL